MKKKHTALAGIICLAILGVAAYGVVSAAQEKSEPAISAKISVIRPIPTAAVLPLPADSVRTFPGKVRASRRVELAFSVSGLLQELNAQEGLRMKKGEVLAKLDQRDFRPALDAAKARCSHAKRELVRYRSLLEQKVVCASEFESIETTYEIALAEMHIQKKAFEDTVLMAPFDGVVVRRYVENHEHVKSKQVILSFQDISLIEVVIQVPERLIAQAKTNGLNTLRIHFDVDPDSNRWFDASIREYCAESDLITRTYDVVVALTTPSDLQIYSGMTATVQAQIQHDRSGSSETEKEVLLVPVESLWRGPNGQDYVWIVQPEGGYPRKTSVDAIGLFENCIKIHSDLCVGQQVAIAGLHSLREDLQVRPMKIGKKGLDG